jgi:hypothetical protein
MRQEKIDNPHASSIYEIRERFNRLNKKLVIPYRDSKEVIELFMSKSHSELNKPKQKMLTYIDYPEIESYHLYRRNSPYQINAGIRELHETLLYSRLNSDGKYKSVESLYKDIYRIYFINMD